MAEDERFDKLFIINNETQEWEVKAPEEFLLQYSSLSMSDESKKTSSIFSKAIAWLNAPTKTEQKIKDLWGEWFSEQYKYVIQEALEAEEQKKVVSFLGFFQDGTNHDEATEYITTMYRGLEALEKITRQENDIFLDEAKEVLDFMKEKKKKEDLQISDKRFLAFIKNYCNESNMGVNLKGILNDKKLALEEKTKRIKENPKFWPPEFVYDIIKANRNMQVKNFGYAVALQRASKV